MRIETGISANAQHEQLILHKTLGGHFVFWSPEFEEGAQKKGGRIFDGLEGL